MIIDNQEPPQTTNYVYAGGYDRLKKYTASGTGSTMTLYLADYEVEGVGNTAGVLQTANLQRINIALMNGQSISLETNPSTNLTNIIYHHTDHLTGSSVDTDSNGYMLEVQDYLPFGGSRVDQKFQSYANKKKFTGKELDPESGLYYYGARYYNADIGRWMGLDPLVLSLQSLGKTPKEQAQKLTELLASPQKLNGYDYVLNNPMKYLDPDGRAESWFSSFVKGAVYSAVNNVTFGLGTKNVKQIDSGGFKVGKFFGDTLSFLSSIATIATGVATTIGGATLVPVTGPIGGGLTMAGAGLTAIGVGVGVYSGGQVISSLFTSTDENGYGGGGGGSWGEGGGSNKTPNWNRVSDNMIKKIYKQEGDIEDLKTGPAQDLYYNKNNGEIRAFPKNNFSGEGEATNLNIHNYQ